MTKRKPMRREVRCLYKALLKNNGVMLDPRKIIGFYEEYNDLHRRIMNSDEAPASLKRDLPPQLKMPLYLKWIKQYLIEEE